MISSHVLSVAMLTKWNKKKLHQKVLYVAFYPIRVLFNLTIPSAKDKNWNKIFAVLYPMSTPMVFLFAMNGILFQRNVSKCC